MGKKDKKGSGGKLIFVLLILVGLAACATAGIAQFSPEKLDTVSMVQDHLVGEANDSVRYGVGGGGLVLAMFGFLVVKPRRKKK